MKHHWHRYRLYIAWVISLVGLCTSLTFSEVLSIEPCPLCWYQRSALFPLVVILGIAAYRGDQSIGVYALPLALLGAFFALYQIVIQWRQTGCAACARTADPLLTVISAVGFVSIALCFIVGSRGWQIFYRFMMRFHQHK